MFTIFPGAAIPIESTLLGLIRLFFFIGFGLYIVFAFVAVRQIEIMRKTVETTVSSFVRILGYAHLVVSLLIALFVFSVLSF